MRKIKTLDAFDQWALEPDRQPVAVQVVDLRDRTEVLNSLCLEHCLFLGCNLGNGATAKILSDGGIVIPDRKVFKFAPHRSDLYTVEDLFEGYFGSPHTGHHCTYDYKIYHEYKTLGMEDVHIDVSLHRRLHDHSITDALHEKVNGHQIVAIMGGHDLERASERYRSVARIARRLALEGYVVITGGGPGAMEAAHLGVYLAGRTDDEFTTAITAETFTARRQTTTEEVTGKEKGEYADRDWLYRAWCLREKYQPSDEDRARYFSVGIPTWFYGHEPPNVFATWIAKYFANSVREDGLLMLANHGIVFAPGNAGTIQEIFQDAAQNYYKTSNYSCPMILLDRAYWTKTYPAWPLLSALAEKRRDEGFPDLIALTDDENEIITRIRDYDPEEYKARDS